jgi:MFS family permease
VSGRQVPFRIGTPEACQARVTLAAMPGQRSTVGGTATSRLGRLRRTWADLGPQLRRLMLVTCAYTMVIGASVPFEAVYLAHRFGTSFAVIGALSTAAGFLNLPIQLGGGHLSDRWGRRPLLLLGTLSPLAGCVGLAAAPSFAVAALAFLVLSVGLALLFPLTQAMAADLADPERQERSFAWVYTALGVGWALGTIIGGVAGTRSYTLVFVIGALLAVVASFTVLTLRESAPGHTEDQPAGSPGGHAWEDRRFLLLGGLVMATWLVGGQLLVTLPIWVVQSLGYPSTLFGGMMALNGLLIAVGQVGLSGRVSRFAPAAVMGLGAVGFGVGYGLMALPWVPVLLTGTLLLTVGEMLLVPTTSAAVDRLAPFERRGQYQGAVSVLQSLGIALGPLAGGLVLQAWGGPALWLTCLAWACVCGAGFVAYGGRRPRVPHAQP